MKQTRMYVNITGTQINFIPAEGSALDRESIAHITLDHDVGLMQGIQGKNFFRALYEHIDEVFKLCRYFVGHTWPHHVPIYRHIGLNVEILHECEIDGHPSVFVIVTRN